MGQQGIEEWLDLKAKVDGQKVRAQENWKIMSMSLKVEFLFWAIFFLLSPSYSIFLLEFLLSLFLPHSFLFFSLFLSKNTLGCSYRFTNFPVSFHCPFPPSSFWYLLLFLSTIIPQICCCTAIPESAQVRSNVCWLHLTLEIFKTDGFNRLLTIANCLNCFNCGRFFIPLQTLSPGPQPPCQTPREVSLSPAPLSITSAPWPCQPWGAHADPPGAHGTQQPVFPAPSLGSGLFHWENWAAGAFRDVFAGSHRPRFSRFLCLCSHINSMLSAFYFPNDFFLAFAMTFCKALSEIWVLIKN